MTVRTFQPVEELIAQMARFARSDRRALAAALEAAPVDQRRTMIEYACIDHGGCLIPNAPMGRWGPAEAQVSLLGICGIGATLDAAIAQWIKCAIRAERAMTEEERAA